MPTLVGLLIAVYLDGKPVTLIFGAEEVEWLPVFSAPEKAFALEAFGVNPPFNMKVIDDHNEFVASVKGKVRLMLDPWQTERRTTRFTELRMED